MSPKSESALQTLRLIARSHPGASSGEWAAAEMLRNLSQHSRIDFMDCFCRLDGLGKRAVIQLLDDIASGQTGLIELG